MPPPAPVITAMPGDGSLDVCSWVILQLHLVDEGLGRSRGLAPGSGRSWRYGAMGMRPRPAADALASPRPDCAGLPNHSPEFVIDKKALPVGVQALVGATLAYMNRPKVALASR